MQTVRASIAPTPRRQGQLAGAVWSTVASPPPWSPGPPPPCSPPSASRR